MVVVGPLLPVKMPLSPVSSAAPSDSVLELALQIASLPTTTLAVAQSINLTSESP
jgi:hypothetical protein